MAKAIRPVFLPSDKNDSLVDIINIEFEWHMGMSISQKKKSMESLHKQAKEIGLSPVLEISTRSEESVGINLSAFNLSIKTGESTMSVESAFQGSKIFENGGPFTDLYFLNGREVKKDNRLKESGNIIGFKFNNEDWPIEPKTLFYDWLYLSALKQNKHFSNALFNYKSFSDIAFNPKKSINCQAHSAALFVSLSKKGYIPEILNNKKLFIDLIKKYNKRKTEQQKLL